MLFRSGEPETIVEQMDPEKELAVMKELGTDVGKLSTTSNPSEEESTYEISEAENQTDAIDR